MFKCKICKKIGKPKETSYSLIFKDEKIKQITKEIKPVCKRCYDISNKNEDETKTQ